MVLAKPTAKPKKETKKAEAPKAEQPTVEKPKAEPVRKRKAEEVKKKQHQSRSCRLQQHDGGRIKSTSKRARYYRVLSMKKAELVEALSK
jgi:outer membrane biosynthesis protein TonB